MHEVRLDGINYETHLCAIEYVEKIQLTCRIRKCVDV